MTVMARSKLPALHAGYLLAHVAGAGSVSARGARNASGRRYC